MWIFLAAIAALTAPAERLAMPAVPGFESFTQSAQAGSIDERIPRGETLDAWTRMITLITIHKDIGPQDYAPDFEASVLRACPGAKARPRIASRIGTHPAIDGRVDCPRNPATSLPETFLYRVASDGVQLHMVQVAFRSVPGPADLAWAQARIDSAMLCPPGSRTAGC